MCWVNKCCYYFSLDVGCILIGLVTFIFGGATTIGSATLVRLDKDFQRYHGNQQHYLQTVFDFDMNRTIIDIVVVGAIVMGVLSMLFGTILIVGIKKNIPGMVLSYFIGGTVLTIVCFLSALLELVNMFWILAAIKILICCVNLHFLVVVHTTYEVMTRGKIFIERDGESDQEPFVESYPDVVSQ